MSNATLNFAIFGDLMRTDFQLEWLINNKRAGKRYTSRVSEKVFTLFFDGVRLVVKLVLLRYRVSKSVGKLFSIAKD